MCSAEHQKLYSTQSGTAALGPVLSDATSWRNRDQSRMFSRLLTLISDNRTAQDAAQETSTLSLPISLNAVSQVTSSLFGEAGSLADSMKSLWAHDGQKGSRSMRKKALTDLVKLLSVHGAASCSLWHTIHSMRRVCILSACSCNASWFSSA